MDQPQGFMIQGAKLHCKKKEELQEERRNNIH